MTSFPEKLHDQLLDARRRTLELTRDLTGERLFGPRIAIVNPVLWELGHVAWFQERWCLRTRPDETLAPSIFDNADALYDSSAVAHDTRWDLPLPTLAGTLAYQERVLELVLRRLEADQHDEWLHYFVHLVLFHEDMHGEAFHYTRQTLEYDEPGLNATGPRASARPVQADGDALVPGGTIQLGTARDSGFVFDNEKWAHPVRIDPFSISRTPVTNAQYLEFVREDGYRRREFWSPEGQAWIEARRATAPQYWQKRGGEWLERRFDRRMPLRADLPVMHVSWHEANAYCRYAGRRLPSEAEWECAAAQAGGENRRYPWGDAEWSAQRANLGGTARTSVHDLPAGDSAAGCRQMLGNVWEWTSSTFLPFPGFVADPYREYSEPWFGTHKVLRGGSFATPARLIRNSWRNFYTPDRYDVFAGFRTCALDPS